MTIPRILSTSASALLISLIPAGAVDFTWNAGTGDWATAANWINGVPGGGGGNFVIINNGGTANITSTTNPIQDPFIGRGVGGVGHVNQTAGDHANSGWTFIGTEGGTGTWDLSGSTSFSTGRIYLGGRRESAGGTGTMTVATTGTVAATSDFSIGTRGGSGTLNVSSGNVNANSWMIIGETVNGGGGSSGVVNQTGGTVTNGAVDANGRFWLGSNEGNSAGAASSGTYNLVDGVLNVRNISIGKNYTGTFNQSGGTANFTQGADDTRIGAIAGSNGSIVLSGGTLNTNGNTQIGAFGTGSLTMSAGTLNSAGWLVAGRFAGGTGTMDVSGGILTHNNNGNSLIIAEDGTGTLTVSGTGEVNVNSTQGLRIGHGATANGTLNVNTGGTLGAHFIQKTNGASTANINLNGGTLKALANTGDYFVGMSNANIELLSGGVTFNSNGFTATITQPLDGVGGFTKSGAGTLVFAGDNTYTGGTIVSGGTLAITGNVTGTISTTVTAGGTLSFGNGGATGTLAGDVDVTGAVNFERTDDHTNTNTLTGTGTVNKNRTNTLTLAGDYTGLTGAVNVNAGGLIASGPFAGSVNVNGTGRLIPAGSVVGTLTTAGFTADTGATIDFDFTAGGATFDQIITGTLTFGSAFTLNLYDEGTATPFATNGTYALFDYSTTLTGSPSVFSVGNPVVGKSYQLGNNAIASTVELFIADAIVTAWGNAGGGLWTLAGNWVGGVPNGATADATFGAAIGAASSIDLNGSKTVGRLTFDNAASYTLGGTGTLTLDNGLAASTVAVLSGDHAIDAPLALAGSTTFNTGAFTSLRIGDLSGAAVLTKTGDGTLILNGTSAYTGSTLINGGILQIGTGSTTGTLAAGSIAIGTGAALAISRSDAIAIPNSITGAGSLIVNDGAVLFTGSATHTGATDLNGSSFTSEGIINGTASLAIDTAALFTAASATTVTGPLTIGTTATADLTVNGTSTLTVGGATSIGASSSFTGSLAIEGGASANFNGLLTIAAASTTATLNINTTGTVGSAENIIAGGVAGSTGTLNIVAGTVTQTGAGGISIGQNGGSGSFAMTGGALTAGGGGFKFADAGVASSGLGTLIGGTITTTGEIWAGNGDASNSATVNISGGSVSSNNWIAIGRLGATGTVNLTGGSLNKTGGNGNHIIIGSIAGVGTLNQSGTGILTSSGDVRLGENNGGNRSDGSLWDMSAGIATIAGTINVGWLSSTAQWNLSGGSATATRLAIGSETGGAGIAVGTTTITDGTLAITGGGTDSRIGGDIVGSAGSTGTLNIGGGAVTIANNFQVGAYGVGALNMSAGSLSVAGWPVVGRFAGSSGTASISGGTFSQTNNGTAFIIGEDGTGILNVSGTALVDVRSMRVGHAATGSGTVNLTGGTLLTGFIQKTNAAAFAQINFDGGFLKAAADSADFFPGFTGASLNIAAGGAHIDTNGFGITISQSLAGTGALTQSGAGTLTFGARQTLAALHVGAVGTVRLAPHAGGPAAILPIDTTALTIAGGKLDLTNNAMVVRGGDIGDITDLVTSGSNGLAWDGAGINSSTAFADTNFLTGIGVINNAEYGYTDFANVTGLTGAEILVKYTYYGDSDLSGQTTADDFTLFFDGFTGAAPASWLYGDYDYDGAVTVDDFTLFVSALNSGGPALAPDAPAPVPEPGSLALLFAGALALLRRRR